MFSKTFLGVLTVAGFANPAGAQSLLYKLDGSQTGDAFGSSVQNAGDVNGDGFSDMIVGGSQISSGPGVARVISGQNGTVIHQVTGDTVGDWLGFSVCGIGDVDGDLLGDFIVGAPQAADGLPKPQAGLARVFSGADGSILREFRGASSGDLLGWSVAGAGDVDGDGTPDVVIGASDADVNGASSGTVTIISGATWQPIYTLHGSASFDLFGYAVAGVGDLNGDQKDEVAIGAPGLPGTLKTGFVQVISGATGLPMWTWNGDSVDDGFGRAVARAGLVDGDAVGDVVVGAPQNGQLAPGYARIFSGQTGATLRTATGDDVLDRFGFSVSGAGDVNDDGADDVLIGAPLDDDGGNSAGSARIVSGADGSEIHTFHGTVMMERLGNAVVGNVDFNGDSEQDLLVGANGANAGATGTGRAQVFSSIDLKFTGEDHIVSISAGVMSRQYALHSPAHANMRYRILGSVSGTAPGTPFMGETLPLVTDRYFLHTLNLPFVFPLRGARGRFDAQGDATAEFRLPGPIAAASQLGKTFYHAYVIFDASGNVLEASNAVPMTVVP